MARSKVDPSIERALQELFEARARFFDRVGDDSTSLAAWSRALRAMSLYQAPVGVKRKILQSAPIAEEIVADIESRWICTYPVDDE